MKLIKIILAVLFLNSSFALAQEKIVWGMINQLDQYKIIAKEFKNYIEEKTNNEIQIEIKTFSEERKDALSDISQNEFQIYQVTTNDLLRLKPNLVPELAIWDVLHLFRDKNHVETYINSSKAQNIIKKLASSDYLPVTYSYAGGFVGLVSTKQNPDLQFDTPRFCPFSQIDSQHVTSEDIEKFKSALPCNALLYELNEFKMFDKKFLNTMQLDISNHKVVARVTIVSQKALNKISPKYRELFISKLKALLDQERQAIYQRADQNIKWIEKSNLVTNKFWSNKDLEKFRNNSINDAKINYPVLNNEISFVNNLFLKKNTNKISQQKD